MNGPYQTGDQAAAASLWSRQRADRPAHADTDMDAVNWADLTGALDEAGVELGAFDRSIIGWLAGWEPAIVAVISGLIGRARHAGLTAADRRTVLAALDVAADAKRDAAERCADCDGEPDGGLCGTCEGRLAQADEFDALAERIGGAS